MANPQPTIVFSANFGQPQTETMGPAYAAYEVGHMNVNSGQSVPVTGGGPVTTTYGNAPTDNPLGLLDTRTSWLAGGMGQGSGNQGKGAVGYVPPFSAAQMNGVSTGFLQVLKNLSFGQPNASMPDLLYENVDFTTNTLTLYGSQAIYVRNMYCDADVRDKLGTGYTRFSGTATPDRNFLTVVSYNGDTLGTTT